MTLFLNGTALNSGCSFTALRLVGKALKRRVASSSARSFTSSLRKLKDQSDDILVQNDLPLKRKDPEQHEVPGENQYVSVLTLNQPTRYNPLSLEVLKHLEKQLNDINDAFPKHRCIVIKAAPGKAFCAGHDMKEIHQNLHQHGEGPIRQLFETCGRVMESLQTIKPVTIASVDGIATAAGCQLVAAADLAIATKTSRFSLAGVHNGFVCSTPIVPVSRNIPHRKHALEMLLTGDFISAEQAYENGLINKVVEDAEELETATMDLVHRITRHSSYAIARGKDLFYKQHDMNIHDAYTLATDRIVDDIVNSADACEGISAFVEKRKPQWKS